MKRLQTHLSPLTDNVRYAKPHQFIRHWKFDSSELFCGDGRKGAARCNLLNGMLMMSKQVKQESSWHSSFRSKCRKATSDANLAVCEIHDTHRSADANQDITRLRQFGRGTRLDRRLSERQVSKENLSLVELHSLGFIQGLTNRRLPHVYV